MKLLGSWAVFFYKEVAAIKLLCKRTLPMFIFICSEREYPFLHTVNDSKIIYLRIFATVIFYGFNLYFYSY